MREYVALQCGEARDFMCSSAINWEKKGEEKFNQTVYVNYKLDEFINLLDVMNSVYDKIIASETLCNVL